MDLNWKIFLLSYFLLIIDSSFTPYQRGFDCNDESIKKPFVPLEIPLKILLPTCLLIPILTIVAIELIVHKGKAKKDSAVQNGILSKIYHEVQTYHFGFLMNMVIVLYVKKFVGRLRPHALEFCNAMHLCNRDQSDPFINEFTCHNDDHPHLIANARQSFFSGHSALGIFAGTYMILYLSSKIRKTNLFLIILYSIIFLVSLYPGFSQWNNYWHFASDVITGFSFGSLEAVIVFYFVNSKRRDLITATTTLNYMSLKKLNNSVNS